MTAVQVGGWQVKRESISAVGPMQEREKGWAKEFPRFYFIVSCDGNDLPVEGDDKEVLEAKRNELLNLL